jgi:hypothetical protein
LVSDEILSKLLADIEAWKANLPDNLKFRGADTPQNAGGCLSFSCLFLVLLNTEPPYRRLFFRLCLGNIPNTVY